MPINEIIKTKVNSKNFQEKKLLASIPSFTDPSEIIVDNEDQGFIYKQTKHYQVLLKKLLEYKNKTGKLYAISECGILLNTGSLLC